MANLFGAGVKACYRGTQLYDTPQTKSLVKHWVEFYKKHSQVLEADIIHVRRPDGRDYDAILHVNPEGEEKGLLMIYNPLNEPIKRNLNIDLYYTGLTQQATLTDADGNSRQYSLDERSQLALPVEIPANSQVWFVIQ